MARRARDGHLRASNVTWRTVLLAVVAAGVRIGPAEAKAKAPVWMVGVSGGATSRTGDTTRPFGSVAVTRKLGSRSYLRISVTRFGSAVRQVDVMLPSTYTLGFVSAGTTFGSWFVNGYAVGGVQHYRSVVTALGPRAIVGSSRSGVLGAGADGGHVHRFARHWSLTPSASVQYIRSKALREQIGSAGPSEYETRETGATFGGTLRLDRYLGKQGLDDVSVHLTRYVATNASAALVSGTRGAITSPTQAGTLSDGWFEVGASSATRLRDGLYVDAAVSRTSGARSGDVTTVAIGARVLW